VRQRRQPGVGGSKRHPGVTATTIRVGVPYVDLAAIRALGVNMSWGSVPDAFNAIIDNINAHGGINGRKIVPYLVAVNPSGTAPAATACTQLIEDDTVFVAIGPLEATCYLEHDTPVVASIYAAGTSSNVAQDFTTTPPNSAYDPLQLSVFDKQGVFKHKKVAPFGGDTGDGSELALVQSALAKLRVPVVTTAVDSAPEGDIAAENAMVTVIAQRFESDGVNEVVAVGDGSAIWPEGLSAIQSIYNPPWVATSESDFTGAVSSSDNPIYLKNMVTSSPLPPPASIWDNSVTQKCVALDRKDYPTNHINAFNASLPDSEETWLGIEIACADMALFTDVATAAGKDLTVSSFVHAGYRLKNLILPGANATVSFGPGRPYALGPVYMVHYDAATEAVVYANTSVTG
jgi:branched-chain amino acid transport system substrate-binding protein